ncbi:MAG TPA: hypothetical protein VGM90_18370 [Kofleriaceae bacterium]|jgi:hypothetical protein
MSTLRTGVLAASVLLAAVTASADPMFGVSTDVGVPDGAMASLVVRPASFVKAHVGAGYNMISPGYRAGITLALPTWFTPTLSLSYGKYKEGDANPLARMVSGDETIQNAKLEKIGYDFADGYVGVQFGRKRVQFQIEAGYSRIHGTVHNLDDMGSSSDPDSKTEFTLTQDPNVTVWSVSARLGLTVYVK